MIAYRKMICIKPLIRKKKKDNASMFGRQFNNLQNWCKNSLAIILITKKSTSTKKKTLKNKISINLASIPVQINVFHCTTDNKKCTTLRHILIDSRIAQLNWSVFLFPHFYLLTTPYPRDQNVKLDWVATVDLSWHITVCSLSFTRKTLKCHTKCTIIYSTFRSKMV